ncbi:MAG: PD-(D/E)XK nuclease family protein [Acidobacteria bacterium]|nr:PD-(D/E)XK nuclease family protein [Acidobacteriota bacterium]
MILTISGIRQFRRCQRQWCYDALIASHSAKDGTPGREAHLLSQLQSIAAWRGSIVDQVITRRLIPALKKGWAVTPAKLHQYADSVFDEQLSFARQNRMREPGMTKVDNFAAFAAVEYGPPVKNEELERARAEIKQALSNLFEMKDLLVRLQSATHLVPQRPLTFPHLQVSFKAVPDLIAFFDDKPPLIVDWKVHARGVHDYRLQLAAYAIALTRCDPHDDFPASLSEYSPTQFDLLEVQLLTKQQRQYWLSEDEIAEVDDYIAEAAVEMLMLIDGKAKNKTDPLDFPVTTNPELCRWCSFRRICSEDVKCQASAQTTLF